MSSTVEVAPGTPIEKDTTEKKTVVFNWDADLATSVTISTSTFTITRIRPVNADDDTNTLTKDNPSILSGSRKTQVRILTGTLGGRYQVTNHIVTNESPAQEKEGSIFVELIDK